MPGDTRPPVRLAIAGGVTRAAAASILESAAEHLQSNCTSNKLHNNCNRRS
jgi:hypothetical protein